MINRKGFTLAEVLITLGIIGVVAAMTMPTLISSFRKHVYVNSLKKAYATWQNIFHKIQIDDGYFTENLYETEFFRGCFVSTAACERSMEDNLKKYLKVFTVELPGHHSENIRYFNINSNPLTALAISANMFKILNADGIVYYLHIRKAGDDFYTAVYADINGSKLPNTMGRDLFLIAQINEAGKLVSKPYDIKDCLGDEIPSIGYSCLARIIEAGWQMKY